MDATQEIRRARLRRLIEEYGGPLNLARRVGQFGASYLTQLAGPHPTRVISEKFARKVETALKLPPGWLDTPDSAPPAPRAASTPLGDTLRRVLQAVEQRHLVLQPDQLAAVVLLAQDLANGSLDTLLDLVESLTHTH